MSLTFKGYYREDGTVGIRNHVLVLPSVFCASKVCEEVANGLAGVITVNHQHGCGQIGDDKEQTRRTLVDFALNPNVYGVVVIGLGCEGAAAKLVAEEISNQSPKPVRVITIQGIGGTLATIAEGRRLAQELVVMARQQELEDIPLSELSIAMVPNQGEPDVTASSAPIMKRLAERLIQHGATVVYGDPNDLMSSFDDLRNRCENAQVQEQLSEMAQAFKHGRNETNAYANMVSSIGQLKEVVKYASRFTARSGIVWMDGPHHELEQITGLAAAGVQLTVLGTGYGSVASTPVVPVFSIASNHELYEALANDLDFDAGEILLESAAENNIADQLFQNVVEVFSGKMTRSEELKIADFAINRIGTSI